MLFWTLRHRFCRLFSTGSVAKRYKNPKQILKHALRIFQKSLKSMEILVKMSGLFFKKLNHRMETRWRLLSFRFLSFVNDQRPLQFFSSHLPAGDSLCFCLNFTYHIFWKCIVQHVDGVELNFSCFTVLKRQCDISQRYHKLTLQSLAINAPWIASLRCWVFALSGWLKSYPPFFVHKIHTNTSTILLQFPM